MIDKFSASTGAAGAIGTPGVETSSEERKQIALLAQQFEAMLISQMLREMKESMTAEQESGGFGADIMGDTVNTEFSMALSRSGGLGLAESLMKSLQKLDPKAAEQLEKAAPAVDGLRMPSAESPFVTDPAISSAFGWRADPLHGHRKFHNGTDIKLAYGEEVRSAAAGVVTFAGEQPGYGLVVKVDHGDGLETRYAHLSSTDVRPGMAIEAGTPIARSGNSGRTTGPHLHFEVRKDGQPIDPERVIGFAPVAGNDVATGH